MKETIMKDQWFRWEREASIHLLFPTLEVFYRPLCKYSGVLAPTMVLILKNGVVTWCIKEKEFVHYGRNLLKIYSDSKKEKKMVADIEKALRYLKQIEVHQKKLDLQSLKNDELLEEHARLYQAFLEYYTMGAIGTPLSFVAEIDLKSKGLTDEELNMLTTPKHISYISRADQFLTTTKDITGFIRKYFWINNNYSGTRVITEGDVKQKLKLLLSKKSVLRKSRAIELKVKLSKIDRRLVELLKHYSVYKDDRKEEILVYLHYMDRILQEVARRMGLSIEEVRASCPFEFKDILHGILTRKELDGRLHYSVIVWERDKKEARILRGLNGKNWEEKTLAKSTHGVKIIKGNTASLGKVTGKVRILLKAEDSNQLKDGEVLVTFMTSPDFMPAIRRCSAIVTNLGGVTSHAAIISRELRLPCIVGTKIATQVLKDGDMVEVNANKGIVRILEKRHAIHKKFQRNK